MTISSRSSNARAASSSDPERFGVSGGKTSSAGGPAATQNDVSAPYRIHNPAHGVTDVLHSDPPAGPASEVRSLLQRFSAEVYFAAAETLALEGHVEPALRALELGMEIGTPSKEARALYARLLEQRSR